MSFARACWSWIPRLWKWLKWPVALAIVAFLFYQNRDGFDTLAGRAIDWPAFAMAFAAALSNVLLAFYRWCLLVRAQGFALSMREATRIGFVGYVLHLVGAGTIGGDFARAAMVAREQTFRRAAAVLTVFFDRALGLLTLLCVGAVAALFQLPLVRQSTELTLVAGVLWFCSGSGVIGLVLLLHPNAVGGAVARCFARLPLLGSPMATLSESVAMYHGNRAAVGRAFAVGLACHTCGLSAYYFCSRALPTGTAAPGWLEHMMLIPSAVVAEIVAPLPGGIGALEAAVQYCYVMANAAAADPLPTHVAAEAGFQTALAFRLLTLIISAIGIGYYFSVRKQLSGILQPQESPEAGPAADGET